MRQGGGCRPRRVVGLVFWCLSRFSPTCFCSCAGRCTLTATFLTVFVPVPVPVPVLMLVLQEDSQPAEGRRGAPDHLPRGHAGGFEERGQREGRVHDHGRVPSGAAHPRRLPGARRALLLLRLGHVWPGALLLLLLLLLCSLAPFFLSVVVVVLVVVVVTRALIYMYAKRTTFPCPPIVHRA